MAEEKFNIGDVVKLKSGGPDMTIKQYYDENSVRCIWFIDGLLKEDFFPAAALKKVEDHDESVFQ